MDEMIRGETIRGETISHIVSTLGSYPIVSSVGRTSWYVSPSPSLGTGIVGYRGHLTPPPNRSSTCVVPDVPVIHFHPRVAAYHSLGVVVTRELVGIRVGFVFRKIGDTFYRIIYFSYK